MHLRVRRREERAVLSEIQAGQGVENTHRPNPDMVAVFADSMLSVNLDRCTSCSACYRPDVCPVGAIYSVEKVPDGSIHAGYNASDPNKGHAQTFGTEAFLVGLLNNAPITPEV
jgi:ferredoxin